ncbi:MAG: hypothetical protein HYX20_02590 [Candidatus Yanofskybacteria bacterium]|nr:hypothetical protein [Candidatus Yanofskybacteria bacterium]
MTWHTIGFDKNKFFFETVIKNGQLSHAYLFTGQDMIGKRTFALELVQNLFKISLFRGSTSTRLSLYEVEPLNNPDVLFVNSANSESGQTIAIEDVRKIKNFISLSPYSASPYKFVVIDNAYLMTVEAQNALLKVLEEPNLSSILILVSANSESLLPTIVSRCQEIKFQPHSQTVIKIFLADFKLSKTKIDFLTDFANGRIGLIKKIIDEKSFDEVKESVEEVMYLIKSDINERLTIAQKLTDEKNKAELPKKVLYWMLYLRMRLNEPKTHKILKNLLVLYEVINKPQFNQRLALENFLVSLA